MNAQFAEKHFSCSRWTAWLKGIIHQKWTFCHRLQIFCLQTKLSRNNLHHQSNQPPAPAHNHQSTDHEHLQPLTTTIHKLTHLSHSSAWSQGYTALNTGRCLHICPSILDLVTAWVILNKPPFTSICLSVSLTSMWQKTSSKKRKRIEDSMDSRDASSPEAFTELVHTLRESLIPPPVTVIATTSPMARPTSFSGEVVTCNGFLLQCSLYFELQSHQFTTEWSKVAFIISLLDWQSLAVGRGIVEFAEPEN